MSERGAAAAKAVAHRRRGTSGKEAAMGCRGDGGDAEKEAEMALHAEEGPATMSVRAE